MKKYLQVSLIFLFVGCLVSCDFGAKNILIKEILSPVGENKVVIFQRDVGATTGFSVQVSVLKSNQDLKNSEKGNIFILDGEKADFEAGKLLITEKETARAVSFEAGQRAVKMSFRSLRT